MKVVFKTNLDWYKDAGFPVMDIVPRIGEKVAVSQQDLFRHRNLPLQLTVVDVTYLHDDTCGFVANVDLWYGSEVTKCIDTKRWSHLMKQ